MKFDLLNFSDKMAMRAAKLVGKSRSIDTRSDIAVKAYEAYDNIAGRFDVPQAIPTRILHDVKAEDVPTVQKLGAKFDEVSKQWIVPDKIDLNRFNLWWTPVPEDLRDSNPRWTMTRNGRRMESYVAPEDMAKGADSTVTSIMYGALPVVAALSYFLGAFSGLLSILALMLAIPFIVAISQGEGIKEGVKTTFLLLLFPAFGSQMVGSVTSTGAGVVGSIPILGVVATGGIAGLVGITVCLTMAILLWSLLFPDKDSLPMGGFFERLKNALKWGLLFAVMITLVAMLPAWMAPAALILMACLYPLKYTEDNYRIRAQLLKENGERFNLSTQGALSSAHVGARLRQCENALKDKTPLIEIGTAVGHLARKQYGYAPDEGTRMVLSCHDFSMHFIGFGATGRGKTSSMARPIILQYKQSRFGGALIRCGKGTLPGELRSIIDIMIEPGVRFAPFMGLDAKELAIALNSLQPVDDDPRNHVWTAGADDVVDHVSVILEALVQHEKRRKAGAVAKAREIEDLINRHQAQLAKESQLSLDTARTEESLSKLIKQHEAWATLRDEPRRHRWTPHSFMKLLYAISDVSVSNSGQSGPGVEITRLASELGYGASPERIEHDPDSIHPDIGRHSLLDGSLDFVLQEWPATEPGQRSSFMINVMRRVAPLLRGRDLRDKDGTPWAEIEEGIDVSQALYGKFVGVNLPVNQHGRAAQITAALVRQRIYSGIRNRQDHSGKWQEMLPGQMPVMDMVDECQLIVSREELQMAPIARSLGLSMVMLTQEFEGLITAFNSENKATHFCNQFQSWATMRTSDATYLYLMKRLGTAMVVRFKSALSGLDFEGGINNLIHSPLNDPDHPNRSAMRKMERLGAGRFEVDDRSAEALDWHGQRARGKSDKQIGKSIPVPVGGTKEIEPVIKPEEFSALLEKQGRAIVFLNRAGAPRVDVVDLNYVAEGAIPSHDDVVSETV